MKKQQTAIDALRNAIQARIDAGETLTAIAHGAGLAQPILTRWWNGDRGDISLGNADKLAQFLALQITKRPAAARAVEAMLDELIPPKPRQTGKHPRTT